MRHSNQFDRMGMQWSFIGRSFLNQAIVHTKMGRKFGSRHHRMIGNDDIAGTVIQNTNHRTVLHRPTGQIAHPFIGALAIEIAIFQIRKSSTDLFHFADGRQCFYFIVYKFSNIQGDITAITFGPPFLPEISGNLCHLIDCISQCRTVFENWFHYNKLSYGLRTTSYELLRYHTERHL